MIKLWLLEHVRCATWQPLPSHNYVACIDAVMGYLIVVCHITVHTSRCDLSVLACYVEGWGCVHHTESTPTSIQQDAVAVLADMESGRLGEARQVAQLGGTSHARRAYNALLKKLDYGLTPLLIRVNIFNRWKTEIPYDLATFPPHELIGALYQAGWSSFSKAIFSGIAEGSIGKSSDAERTIAYLHYSMSRSSASGP